jgi:hypothetical protein
MRETAALPSSRSADPPYAWWIVVALVAAAALIASLAGGFGTGELPIGMRLFVFVVTIGLNAAKWGAWLWLLRRILPERFWPMLAGGLAGALLLNLSLPIELELAFAALGLRLDLPFWPIYLSAVVIAVIIYTLISTLAQRPTGGAPTRIADAPGASPAEPPPFLAALGVTDPAALLAVRAEDHYLRIHLTDGRSPLVLHRFGDAVAQLRGLDGQQVHRGAWVKREAVVEAFREGRKWRLRLADGAVIPVSGSYVASVRAAGLIGSAHSRRDAGPLLRQPRA